MNRPPSSGRAEAPSAARDLSRQLTWRYVLSLGLVALLAIVGQLVIQSRLHRQQTDARVINLAGRQRMLSQRIAKAALLSDGLDQRSELRRSLTDLLRVHRGLQEGSATLHLPGGLSPEITEMFAKLEPHCRALSNGVEVLLSANPTPAEAAAAQQSILRHERSFLRIMDSIVFRLAVQAQGRVIQSARIELLLTLLTLAVLFVEAVFIFRPAVARLYDSMKALVTARDALARTEAEQQATLEAIPDTLANMTADGRLVVLKTPRRTLFQAASAPGAVLALDELPEPARNVLSDLQNKVRQTKQQATRRVVLRNEDDVEQAFEIRAVPSRGIGNMVIVRDITEQRRLENEVLEATERTQAQVGRELHDGLCQHLAGLALLARSVSKDPENDEIVRLLDEGVAQARELALGLYPATLSNLGLPGALEELSRHVETVSSIVCSPEVPRTLELPNDTALQLYRIAQEAAANAVKHARAQHLVIRLRQEDDCLTLEVEDDGHGFTSQDSQRAGLGLDTMLYRARILDGDLRVVTSGSAGTTVWCRIPFRRGADGSG